MFYVTPVLHPYEDCTSPDLPEELPISWAHCADTFAIVETPVELPPHLDVQRIRGNLEMMLESTRVYPPARALAFSGLDNSPLAWAPFAERLTKLLTYYLENQPISGFQFLRCLKDQGDSLEMDGYGGAGHFYWILAAHHDQVTWVSDYDYMIRSSPVNEFELRSGANLPAELPAPPD